MTSANALMIGGVAAATLTAFALAATQSYLNRSIGTDHAVHAFLVRAIRHNRYRLFDRVPGLINETHCAALPLYLHWMFAHFGDRSMRRGERVLNPAVNALLVALFGVMAWGAERQIGAGPWFVPAAAAAFALTPQFYHALSARNFGLSARGIGLFLLAGIFALSHAVESGAAGPLGWPGLALLAYLLWAFNTFGGQALAILSVLAGVLFGHWAPLAGGALGLVIFIAIHPSYATRYLYHTLRYIRAYAVDFAPVYILARRHSIWRDLIWDIWRKVATGPAQGLRYAYENSVLVVVGLNPLWTVAAVAWLARGSPRGDLVGYSTDIALAGGLAALLTSFRPTRFLGEPERYVEAVTPFAALAGASAVAAWGGIPALAVLAALFLLVDLAQLQASRLLRSHVASSPMDVTGVSEAIAHSGLGSIRCAGNNDQLIKLLLANDWQFVYCMAIEGRHCGMPLREVFSTFPFVRREALQKIAQDMRINLCVMDRSLYDTLYDAGDPRAAAVAVLFENPYLRVIALDWTRLRDGARG